MTTFRRTTVLTLLPSLAFVALLSSALVASQPNALILNPQDNYYLPKFGFNSFNISGYGDRVTFVQWGGLASQLGLEPGDTILSMNGYRLNYHGAWSDALSQAVANGNGGLVRLRVRDVRTGFVVSRQIYVGDFVGPITPKYYANGGVGPHVSHIHHHNGGFNGSYGPVTAKSQVGPNHQVGLNETIKQIKKLIED